MTEKPKGLWSKIPVWGRGLIIIAGMWLLYRATLLFFPNIWFELLTFLGLGSGALVLSKQEKALRERDRKDTAADRKLLDSDRSEIEDIKSGLGTLHKQMQEIPISVDKALDDELQAFSEAKKRIAEQDMTEDQAAEFLRKRLESK